MGIVTQTISTQQYMAEMYDLEYKIDQINQAKLSLTNSLNELMNVGTDLDPDSLEVKQLQERKAKLHQFEKQLDMKLQEYNTRLSIVSGYLNPKKG